MAALSNSNQKTVQQTQFLVKYLYNLINSKVNSIIPPTPIPIPYELINLCKQNGSRMDRTPGSHPPIDFHICYIALTKIAVV